MSADHTNEMTVLNNSQKPGKRETLLPVSLAFQFQGTGKLLGQLGPAEQPCVAWGAWFSLSFCTHCKGLKQKTHFFYLIQLSLCSKPMFCTLLQKKLNSVYLKAVHEHALNALIIVSVYRTSDFVSNAEILHFALITSRYQKYVA